MSSAKHARRGLAVALGLVALALSHAAEARSGGAFGSGTTTQFACNPWLEFCSCQRDVEDDCERMEELVCKQGTYECNSSICWCDLKPKKRQTGPQRQVAPGAARTLQLRR